MAVTENEIESFRNFALGRVEDGAAELTMGQLFAEWRLENPTAAEQREIDVAIQTGLADIKAGRGQAADRVMEGLRAKYGLSGQ